MHTVVCGLGRVGLRVVDLLARLGESVVVVALERHESLGERVRFVVGDARDEAVLLQAGIETAKAVVIVTGDDMTNVAIALDARRLAPNAAIVLRLFDQDLGSQLEASLGIRQVFSTSAIAAPAFVASALGDSVLMTFEVGGARWIVEEVECRTAGVVGDVAGVPVALEHAAGVKVGPSLDDSIRPGDAVVRLRPSLPRRRPGKTLLLRGLADSWRDTPVLLRLSLVSLIVIVGASVLVFRWGLGLSSVDAYYFVITTISTTGYGDFNLQNAPAALKIYGTLVMLAGAMLIAVLYSLVTDLLLRTRLRDVMSRGAADQVGHVVVCGLGSIGIRVLRELTELGEQVVAIERSEGGAFLEAGREIAPVVIGDAKADETLRRAGVRGARALVAATDADLTNLSAALAAKRLAPACKVVLRLFDAELASKLRSNLHVDAVLSVSGSAAPTFVGAALYPNVLRGFLARNALVLLLHRTVGPDDVDRVTDDREHVLLVKRAGARDFQPGASGDAPSPGDQFITARWCRFV